MTDDLDVVLASNRGPVSFVSSESGFELKRGAGGLAGALDPVARRLGEHATWVAAATSSTDRRALAAGAADDLSEQLGYGVYLLDIAPDTYARYYDVVSNRMLWFANHCLWDELAVKEFGREELDAWSNDYIPVNRQFADAVLELSSPSSIVLFQDYHLYLAPGMLRESRPDQVIFHFTHSSFCGEDGLERLPSPIPRTVIEGMLGADLLGFHVAAWVHGFFACCERIGAKVDRDTGCVEHNGRRTWVREYPIPIDAQELRELAAGEKAKRWAERFAERTDGPLIVRSDRAEPSKNIVRGFEAFGMVLDRRPELSGKVHFAACLYPSRQSMPEYRRYTQEIEDAVSAVNARHPASIELFMQDDYDRTLGALSVYDVLLVNPIMDGMNLVAKEGPTVNQADGALVLSTGAGAYEELGDAAIGIEDPLDLEQTAAAISRALDLSMDERRERAEALRKQAVATKPGDWISSQLDDLQLIQDGRPPKSPPV